MLALCPRCLCFPRGNLRCSLIFEAGLTPVPIGPRTNSGRVLRNQNRGLLIGGRRMQESLHYAGAIVSSLFFVYLSVNKCIILLLSPQLFIFICL